MRTVALALAALLGPCAGWGGETAAPPGPSAGPVPEGFVTRSAWFETRQRGWVLGDAGEFPGVAATEDGGRTWTYLGDIMYTQPRPGDAMPSVTRVRHAHGVWAIGAETVSREGTGPWTYGTRGARRVVSVAIPGEGTLRLMGLADDAVTREAEVWFAIGDSDERLDRAPVAAIDDLEVRGGYYYRTTGGSFRASTDGGRTWATRTACAERLLDLAGVAQRRLYLLCEGSVRFSPDGGRTVTVTSRVDPRHRSIAANDRGTVVVAGPSLEVSRDGGRTFRTVSAPRGTWADARFVDASFATVAGPGGLWATSDGGATWTPMRVA